MQQSRRHRNDCASWRRRKTWMPGTRPGKTTLLRIKRRLETRFRRVKANCFLCVITPPVAGKNELPKPPSFSATEGEVMLQRIDLGGGDILMNFQIYVRIEFRR
jgi:hypothetical protein